MRYSNRKLVIRMSAIEIDTNKVDDICKQLNITLKNFEEVINNYYNRINKVNSETNEWYGKSADRFVELVNNEKNLKVLPTIDEIRLLINELQFESDEFKKKSKELEF